MNLFTDELRRNPYAAYEELREAAPLLHFAPADLWLVLDYQGVKRALTDHEAFSSNVAPSRNLRFEWLLFMDPPRHTQLRAIVSRAFTPRSIAELEPAITALTQRLLDEALRKGELELVEELAAPLPMMVMATLLGVDPAEWRRLKSWSDAIVDLGATILGTPEASRAASEAFIAANGEMQTWVAGLAAARRAAPRDDLMTRLVQAEVDGARLDDEELLRFVQLLLAAGTETTTNLIDNAVISFVEHPHEWARLSATPSLLPSAIEEVLRFRSPAQAMFRRTTRDVQMHNSTIPAGAFVLAMIGSANRDPQVFGDPERFDIGRDPNPHLAFGHGLHFCIGAPLSRLEARVALGALLERVTRVELAGDEPWPPRKAFHVHGPTRLPIRVERR